MKGTEEILIESIEEARAMCRQNPGSRLSRSPDGCGWIVRGLPDAYSNSNVSVCSNATAGPPPRRKRSLPLTDAQKDAAFCPSSRILTVAGAGTGKTRTLIARAIYALGDGTANPEEVLLMAFAKKAQGVIQTRMADQCAEAVTVRTFHALGLEIIGTATGSKPSVSRLCDDEKVMADHLTKYVRDMLRDKAERKKALQFLVLLYPEDSRKLPAPNSPMDDALRNIPVLGRLYAALTSLAGEKAEDLKHSMVGELRFRTLLGEKVKSSEEIFLANCLCLNGITYEYETAYKHATADQEHSQYRPDFYLPDYDIYIEHFGINESGETRPDIDSVAYNEAMDWKRQLHKRFGTNLVETYSYQFTQNTVLESLEASLKKHGVKFSPIKGVSPAEIRDLVKCFDITDCVAILRRFIPLFKSYAVVQSGAMTARTSSATAKVVWNELMRKANSKRSKKFLPFARAIVDRYEVELRTAGEVDFSDMIGMASWLVRQGQYASPFKHILVDEFQDISGARCHLLKSLVDARPDTHLFCVGDDWQSIYRFTGSDVSIMVNMDQQFGDVTEKCVDETFRFPQNIADLTSTFVQKNPAQKRKQIQASDNAAGRPAVTVVQSYDTRGMRDEVIEILKEVVAHDKADHISVYLLARYNRELPGGQDIRDFCKVSRTLSVEAMTIHRSKGEEADYVILLNIHGGIHGVPCEIVDDPVLDLVLTGDSGIDHAEERRTFYVALTRGRKAVYIIADKSNSGLFLEELAEPEYKDWVEIRRSTLARFLCPLCEDGVLLKKKGKDGGVFYGCSNYRNGCEQKTLPECPECHDGPVLEQCSEHVCAQCNAAIETCPQCKKGLLLTESIQGFQVRACQAWYWRNNCTYVHMNCPDCSRPLLRRRGKFGDFVACSGWKKGGLGCSWSPRKRGGR